MYKLYTVYGCEWPFYFEASKENGKILVMYDDIILYYDAIVVLYEI